jgi:hypothetical protein
VDFDLQDEVVFLRVENPITGGKTITIDMGDIEQDAQENVSINFDGISAVKAWERGPKKRIYFRAVGVPESAHRSGKVFLELVNGEWMPNMRYKLMQELANQLNSAGIDEPEKVQELYERYLEEI